MSLLSRPLVLLRALPFESSSRRSPRVTRRRSLGLRYHLNRTVLIMRNRSVHLQSTPSTSCLSQITYHWYILVLITLILQCFTWCSVWPRKFFKIFSSHCLISFWNWVSPFVVLIHNGKHCQFFIFWKANLMSYPKTIKFSYNNWF